MLPNPEQHSTSLINIDFDAPATPDGRGLLSRNGENALTPWSDTALDWKPPWKQQNKNALRGLGCLVLLAVALVVCLTMTPHPSPPPSTSCASTPCSRAALDTCPFSPCTKKCGGGLQHRSCKSDTHSNTRRCNPHTCRASDRTPPPPPMGGGSVGHQYCRTRDGKDDAHCSSGHGYRDPNFTKAQCEREYRCSWYGGDDGYNVNPQPPPPPSPSMSDEQAVNMAINVSVDLLRRVSAMIYYRRLGIV